MDASQAFSERVEPQVKQIYEDSLENVLYQILYIDAEIVLLRSEETGREGRNNHRIERRSSFDDQLEAGRFSYCPDSDIDMTNFDEKDWSDVDYIGEITRDNLHEQGIETILDVRNAEDSELLDVDGLGDRGLEKLREFTR